MCGIIGYLGKKDALPVLIEGLRRLEYRGYDSAGVAVVTPGGVFCQKATGVIDNLAKELEYNHSVQSTLGMAHTRWATHGGVTEANAHPHMCCDRETFVVHNGIIENHHSLKEKLIKAGHMFRSQTDTEVIAHLIEDIRKTNSNGEGPMALEESVRHALRLLKGTYGLLVVSLREPDKMIAARNGSPVVLGVGDEEFIIASDPSAIVAHTQKLNFLDDKQMAVIDRNDYRITNIDSGEEQERKIHQSEWTVEQAQKGGYAHFMLKEIFEQPEAAENTMRGRLTPDGMVRLGGLSDRQSLRTLHDARRIIIAACGTSYFAGLSGKYILEEYAGIPVVVEDASEFRYRKPVFGKGDVFFAISQSGETADTLAALRLAKNAGVPVFGICNVVGSTIWREAGKGVYLYAGPEISVASTKVFVVQSIVLRMIAVMLRQIRRMDAEPIHDMVESLRQIPELMRSVLQQEKQIKHIAERYAEFENAFFIGRRHGFPTAEEGALKLKEIAYVHAEGYTAGAMKHGPIALIGPGFMTVAIATNWPLDPDDESSVYRKVISNIQEIRAREGPVLAIATHGDQTISEYVDDVIYVPRTIEANSPLVVIPTLQLLAYHIAVLRGCDIDKPRNLAKSVTVE